MPQTQRHAERTAAPPKSQVVRIVTRYTNELHTAIRQLACHREPGFSGITGAAILHAIASHANYDTGRGMFFSRETLAKDANCSLRTVQRYIPKLIAKGWLKVTQPGVGFDGEPVYAENKHGFTYRVHSRSFLVTVCELGEEKPAKVSYIEEARARRAEQASEDRRRERAHRQVSPEQVRKDRDIIMDLLTGKARGANSFSPPRGPGLYRGERHTDP